MDNIIIIGECKWCRRRKRVNEIVVDNNKTVQINLVCDKCLQRENRQIVENVKKRLKNDDGQRYNQEEILNMMKEIKEREGDIE